MNSSQIILTNPKGEFLLQLREYKSEIDYPGYWGLIGGAIDKGETPLQTIKRETKEELEGCKVTNIDYITKVYDGEERYKQSVSFCFKGRINEEIENIHLTEGQKVQYFKLEEIEDLHLVPMCKKLILEGKWNL